MEYNDTYPNNAAQAPNGSAPVYAQSAPAADPQPDYPPRQQQFNRPYTANQPQGYGYNMPRQQNYAYNARPRQPAYGYSAPAARQYAPRPAAPNGYPAPNSNGLVYSGAANAYPAFQPFFKPPKEIEKDNIKSAASKGGAMSIAVSITMTVVAAIIMIIAMFAGAYNLAPADGDPYMGFTPITFYTLEGLASLVSMFIPGVIIMNSARKSEGMKINDFLPFKPLGAKKTAVIVFAGMGVCMFAQVLASILTYNLSLLGFDVESALDVSYGTTAMDVVLNVVCTAVIPGLVEEFAYRGIVLGALKKYDARLAVLGSAFLFGMVHGNFSQIPFAFVVGLVLGYVRVKTDSMLPGILIHFGNNFYAVILTEVGEVAPESVSSIVDIVFIVVLILVGILCTYSLAKNDKDFFRLDAEESLLTFGEKIKAFLTSVPVIISCIMLIIESIALVELI